ncbi:MAG: hypothetical protein A3J29_06125 [Acidobacteria bacterium RIFCSPLOWO2_12_FULL_67_14b]|nr:MAG: hypothetical protein A3J29_06125 [Acidobacteria bacterium RIFCSPLOWO2_12_FULL_67_14b]
MARTALFSRNTPGGVFTFDDLGEHPGEIYFVDASAAGAGATLGHGKSPDSPFSSLAYAFSSDLLASGDVVYALPGHTESIAAAGTITADIAGVRVIGLGWGSKRPVLTWTATDATIAVSAASVQFRNFLTEVTIDEVVSMWNWTGAWGEMDRVDFRLNTSAEEAIQFLTASAAATDFHLHHCRHHQATPAAANAQWIEFIGARTVIEDNTFDIELTSNAASKILSNGTAAIGLVLARNRIHALGNACIPISCHASSEGIAHDNRVVSGGTLAGKIALGGLYGCENYVATTANKNGILDPVVA